MNFKRILIRAVGVIAAFAMLALSGGLAWAAAGDYATRDMVPLGVTVAGVELGGLSPAEAHEAIERAVVEPLLEPVTVRAAGMTFEVDPADFLHADVDTAVTNAFGPNRSATLADRIYRRLAEEPVRMTVEPQILIDEDALASRVAGIAVAIDYAAVDATLGIEDAAVKIGPSAPGRKLDQEASATLIAAALLSEDTSVDLPVLPVLPEVAEEDLGKWLIIRRASRTLELWEDTQLDRRYPIAIGAEGYDTPRGEWEITLKRYLPTWVNPGSEWAKTMPDKIGPGPGNPLGTRALNLDAPGIRIHGTPNEASIGTAASHGCIRMKRVDIEQLYELVDVGIPVFVVER